MRDLSQRPGPRVGEFRQSLENELFGPTTRRETVSDGHHHDEYHINVGNKGNLIEFKPYTTGKQKHTV